MAEYAKKVNGRPRTVIPGQLPPTYRADVAEVVLQATADGRSLRSVCEEHTDWPPRATIRNWIMQDPEGFGRRYAEARKLGAFQMGEDTVDIADDKLRLDPTTPGNPQRDNLRFMTRKWYAGIVHPEVFGERSQLQHSGNIDSRVQIDVRVVRERVMATVEGIRVRLLANDKDA